MRIEKLKRNFDVEIKLVHFPLHPETPTEGKSMEELYAGRGVDPEAMYNRMKGLMDGEGLPYGRRTHTYNSRLAQELGAWAETQPGGETIHDAFYRAYFVDARNIGDPEVLLAASLTLSFGLIVTRAGMGILFAGEYAAEALSAPAEDEAQSEEPDRGRGEAEDVGVKGTP